MKAKSKKTTRVGVVIPAYRVKNQILEVLNSINDVVQEICVVDDACPEQTGSYVIKHCKNRRVTVLFHEANQGVGAAMKTGFQFFMKREVDVVVKIDGDGQMNVGYLDQVLKPLIEYTADYTKGNRFFSLSSIKKMPRIRLVGNIVLSFFSKASSGYWNTFDPNNGFIAITTPVLRQIDLEKVSNRYFFESDMLFHLNLLRARVVDIPMMAKYESEPSSLNLWKASIEFPLKYLRNLVKRFVLVYFVKDFSLPGFQLASGSLLAIAGSVLGFTSFINSQALEQNTPPGTLVLFALLMFMGFQLLLSFISYDIQNVPNRSITLDLQLIQNGPASKSNNR